MFEDDFLLISWVLLSMPVLVFLTLSLPTLAVFLYFHLLIFCASIYFQKQYYLGLLISFPFTSPTLCKHNYF